MHVGEEMHLEVATLSSTSSREPISDGTTTSVRASQARPP